MLESNLDGLRFNCITLYPCFCRLPPVESSPRPSDGLLRNCAPSSAPVLDSLLPSLHLQRFSIPENAAPSSRLSAATAHHLYQNALQTAHDRVLNVWESATTARRDKVMKELNVWLGTLPADWSKTLLNCSPTDLLAFLETHWLPLHGGTVLPDGTTVASPSGVNLCLSSLTTGFSLLGRTGAWSPLTPHGNPVHSADLQHYRKGYRMQAWRHGYQEASAVPMSIDKTHQLIDYLDQKAASASSLCQRLLYERDALLALLMWDTCLRGCTCGRLTLSDFFLANGAVASLPLSLPLALGTTLLLQPNGTKTVRGHRTSAIHLSYTDPLSYNLLPRLMQYLLGRAALGQPIRHFLFNPLNKDQQSFSSQLMCSSSIGKRLQKHLQGAGLYAGESNHGFRRGRMQHCATQGMSASSIGTLAQISTPAIVARYLDTTRHTPRLERLHGAPT